MWNSCAKMGRPKTAFKYHGMNPDRLNIDDIGRLFKRRGITDRVQNNLVYGILSVLEPPSCEMSQCKSYGNMGAFCNCGAGQIPGKCKILRDFRKRKKEKAVKAADEVLSILNTEFKTDILQVINMRHDFTKFFDEISTRKGLKHTAKWNYSLMSDVWNEIKKRQKIAVKKAAEECAA